jgi:hypothetical protein
MLFEYRKENLMTSGFTKIRKVWLMTAAVLPMTVLLSACPLAAPTAPPSVFDKNHRLVFPRTTQGITIDGAATDSAWADGFQFKLEQGTTNPAAQLRGVSTATDFYISIKVDGDPGYDQFDSAVFLINPDGAPNNYHRLIIQPCGAGGANCSGVGGISNITPVIKYQKDDLAGATVPWDAGDTTSVAGADIRASNVPGGTNNSWQIEMRIPKTGSAFGNFNDNWMGLHASAIVADDPNEEAVVYSWPQNRYITGPIDGIGGTGFPAVAQWGAATLSTAFGDGVSLSYHEFGTNQADPSAIARDAPNIFHAWAINNNQTSGGSTLVTANDVTATFTIRNYGLGDNWPNVPVSGNPSAAVDIPPAQAHLFETGAWNLTPQQVTDYTAFPNQCVKVTLSTTDPNTIINQGELMRNMHFVTVNSPFEATAQLGLDGFEKFMDRENPQLVLREAFVNLDPEFKWDSRLAGAEKVGDNRWLASFKQGNEQKLGVWVSPDDRLQIPSTRHVVAPGTGGRDTKPIQIPVKPDSVITLIADGSIQRGDMPLTASGISPASLRASDKSADLGKLAEGRPDRYGALLGSFDGFKTSFVIGAGASLKVPSNAQSLSLIINDSEEGYAKQEGRGFDVQAIASGITPWMRANFPELNAKESRGHILLPLGINLPAWIVRGQYATRDHVIINKKKFKIFLPAGSFGYWIRDVGRVPVPRQPPIGRVDDLLRPEAINGATILKRLDDGN